MRAIRRLLGCLLLATALLATLPAAVMAPPPDRTPPTERQLAPVTVTSADGSPCPPLREITPRRTTGGCELDVKSDQLLRFSIETAVGTMAFARCRITYTLRIDVRGRTSISDVELWGRSPCGDTLPCWDGEDNDDSYVWHGAIGTRPDGQLVQLADACIHNCVSRFEGPLELPLTPTRKGWRATANRNTLGTSGFELTGQIDIPGDVSITPAPASDG
jgi:hypothetical protein